jgi:hypothetical protein
MVNMKVAICIAVYSPYVNQRLEGTYYPHLQGRKSAEHRRFTYGPQGAIFQKTATLNTISHTFHCRTCFKRPV